MASIRPAFHNVCGRAGSGEIVFFGLLVGDRQVESSLERVHRHVLRRHLRAGMKGKLLYCCCVRMTLVKRPWLTLIVL